MSYAAAQRMAARARLALADALASWSEQTGTWEQTDTQKWHGAVVTLDAHEAAATLGGGSPVVVVQPPEATYPTWSMTEFSWQIVLISHHPEVLDAWPLLSDLADELREPLELDRAQLTMWQPPTGSAWPCALLTTTTTETDD